MSAALPASHSTKGKSALNFTGSRNSTFSRSASPAKAIIHVQCLSLVSAHSGLLEYGENPLPDAYPFRFHCPQSLPCRSDGAA